MNTSHAAPPGGVFCQDLKSVAEAVSDPKVLLQVEPHFAETDPAAVERARSFVKTITDPVILKGPEQSKAIRRTSIPLEATGTPAAELASPGDQLKITPGMGGVRKYAGVDYIEFPNSTVLQTVDPATGKPRTFLIARGVRHYSTDVNLSNGSIQPKGYISDVLLFEVVGGKTVFRSRLLDSIAATNTFFEDPRISTLYFPDGSKKVFLSMTDYSPHVPGATNPDTMNRYVELQFDPNGVPAAIKTDSNRIPKFGNLSPAPIVLPDGQIISIDAKNATLAFNEAGQLVVRTRLRPDFNSPGIQAMAGADRWKYGEQVFVFKDYEEFLKYDWNHCLEDLFQKSPPGEEPRVKPLEAKTILRDTDLRDVYKDPRVMAEKGKGMGPGTTAVRVVRHGDRLYISDGKNAPERFAGIAGPGIKLKDGEVTYLSFDHDILFFMDKRDGHPFVKRHYSLSVKEFDPSLTKIETYYADALQPHEQHELGYNSGIADLQHVYPMGRELIVGADGRARVRISLGASDAHTEFAEVDIGALLSEMAPGSARWQSGQIYQP